MNKFRYHGQLYYNGYRALDQWELDTFFGAMRSGVGDFRDYDRLPSFLKRMVGNFPTDVHGVWLNYYHYIKRHPPLSPKQQLGYYSIVAFICLRTGDINKDDVPPFFPILPVRMSIADDLTDVERGIFAELLVNGDRRVHQPWGVPERYETPPFEPPEALSAFLMSPPTAIANQTVEVWTDAQGIRHQMYEGEGDVAFG